MKQKHLPGKSLISIPHYKLNVRSHVLFFSSKITAYIQLTASAEAEQRGTREVLYVSIELTTLKRLYDTTANRMPVLE